jgi:hypothetical protein
VGSRSRARARAQASQAPTERPSAAQRPAGRSRPQPAVSQTPGPQTPLPQTPGPQTTVPQTPRPQNGRSARHETAGTLPRSVLGAAIVEAVEAVGVLAASVFAAVATANGHSYLRASGIALTLIGIATAVGLALVARAVHAGRRWSRTPAMLTQLFTGIVAIYLLQSGRLDLGIPAIVLAIAGLAALLTPASIEVLTPGRIGKS